MDLERLARRSLLGDFLKSGGAILLGTVTGLAVGLASQRWDVYWGILTMIVAPAGFATLLSVGARVHGRPWIRPLGALGGWLAFVGLFVYPSFNQFLLFFYWYSPVIVLLVASLTASSLIGLGLFAADGIVSRLVRTTEPSDAK